LKDEIYEVVIDSSLAPGSLTYGEYYLEGEIEDDVLISTHCCHPSLCNDNLSGMAVSTFLAKELTGMKRRYSYRFLFIPGAIGSITWLARNEDNVHRIKHGLVVACVGDPGQMTYKKSRQGNAEIDVAVQHVLRHSGEQYRVKEFSPYGYDERQYCSPGFNLAVGSLTRTPHGEFPEYHTSNDNLDFIKPHALEHSLSTYRQVISLLEHNRTYISQNQKCEPQLGKRGLYASLGGRTSSPLAELSMLWVLNLSDGDHSLLDIAERAGIPFQHIHDASQLLFDHELLQERRPLSPRSGE
jgi:aminopeptidase-like protein